MNRERTVQTSFPKKTVVLIALCTTMLLMHSCRYTKTIYTPDELRLLIRSRLSPEMFDRLVIPFEVDDEIRNASLKATHGHFTRREKMWALLYKILSKTDIDMKYDEYTTYTAIETYQSGRGNCLSFTNLIVGMARAVDIDAFFVEVMTEGKYDLIEGLVVNQRHICAGYDVGGKIELVDFTVDQKNYLSYRKIDDVEAIAHYLNNRGYDFLKEGRIDDAKKNFQLAVDIYPAFSWGYNNLAVTLSRKNDIEGAISNYEKAIEIDPSYEAPYGNLASLFFNIGEKEKAERMMDLLDRIKSKNPYQHIARGLMFKERDDLKSALEEMKKAIRLDRKNVKARIEIARIYVAAGDLDRAAYHIRKALRVDPDNQEAHDLLVTIENDQ